MHCSHPGGPCFGRIAAVGSASGPLAAGGGVGGAAGAAGAGCKPMEEVMGSNPAITMGSSMEGVVMSSLALAQHNIFLISLFYAGY